MIAIPRYELEKAIRAARDDIHNEVCGFFFIPKEGGSANWYPAKNIAKSPDLSSEVAAEWMAKHIIEADLKPVAMFHSHPSGSPFPSKGDQMFFPKEYVDEALIWSFRFGSSLTQYDRFGHVRQVHLDGVIIGAAWGD